MDKVVLVSVTDSEQAFVLRTPPEPQFNRGMVYATAELVQIPYLFPALSENVQSEHSGRLSEATNSILVTVTTRDSCWFSSAEGG
jgi:hypothetical protein